jgi:mono/diheme cytochrome c family protein
MLPEPTMDSAPAPEAPPPRDAAEPAAVPGDAPDYQRDIRPILDARCVECHGATKQKGGLRLDSLAAIRAGGERAVLVPGDPERSTLYTALILPADDPDLMPARGGPLDPAQIALIRAWIAAGAPSADESGAALPAPDQPKAKRAAAPPATLYDQLAIGLPAPDPATIATLTAAGAVVTPLSRDGALLEVNLAHTRAPLAAAHLQPLARIAANLAWLDLGGTAVSDALLSHLRPLRNLRRLHLERTAVGDAGLVHLLGLAHLDYLNLVGTRVSDAGLYRLHALKRLERVYLWQSKVTPAGAAKLRAALPQAQVDLGQ